MTALVRESNLQTPRVPSYPPVRDLAGFHLEKSGRRCVAACYGRVTRLTP